ncbi:MAG: DUF4330 domain-containing protein [Tindallia sp. MSAO_Bac2]|nr:MAG: DUF4330 domain-containing protein [Tindallia sp. MSAO_Bac2]
MKKNKVFKIVDFFVLILAVFVVAGIAYKITDGNIGRGAWRAEEKSVIIQAEVYAPEAGMLEHIKVGDQLSEAKQMLDATVTNVEIADFEDHYLDIGYLRKDIGRDFLSMDLVKQKAKVEIEANVQIKGLDYELGTQEVRSGMMLILESELYKFSTRILSVEQVNDEND